MHQVKRCGIKTDWRVVDRRKTDPEQLTLACQAQIGVLFTDHLAAFSGAHRFSPCYKNYSPPPAARSWRAGP